MATSEDLRQPTSDGQQSLAQRLASAWSAELARLAVAGDERAFWTFARVYHLMIEPRALFSPALAAAVAQARVRGHGPAGTPAGGAGPAPVARSPPSGRLRPRVAPCTSWSSTMIKPSATP